MLNIFMWVVDTVWMFFRSLIVTKNQIQFKCAVFSTSNWGNGVVRLSIRLSQDTSFFV